MSPEPHWSGKREGQFGGAGGGGGAEAPSWWEVDETHFVMTPPDPATTALTDASFRLHTDSDLDDTNGALFYFDAMLSGQHMEMLLSGDYGGLIIGNQSKAYLKVDPWSAKLQHLNDGSVGVGNSDNGVTADNNGVFANGSGSNGVMVAASGAVVVQAKFESSAPKLGFYAASPVAQQTGVAVTAEAIHAALVALGLITA